MSITTALPTRPGAIIGYTRRGRPIRVQAGGADTTITTNPYLERRREQARSLHQEITAIQTRAAQENRDLTEDELQQIRSKSETYETMAAEIETLTNQENRARATQEMAAQLDAAAAGGGRGSAADELRPFSLVPTPAQIEQLRSAGLAKQNAEVFHERVRPDERMHLRSTVTLANTGGPVIGVDGRLREPRRIVTAVGLVPEMADASGASGALFGVTEADESPGTSEGGTKPEADEITELAITIEALARWTDITSFARLSARGFLDGLASWHAQFVAKDEDRLIVNRLTAAAGQPIGTGNPAADVRTAVAMVTDAASADADIVIVNPEDYAAVTGFKPANSDDVASWADRIGPALVYPSSAVEPGLVLVAALAMGGRYLVAEAPRTASLTNLKTNVTTVLTEEHVGFGVRLAGSVVAVDLDVSSSLGA